MMPKVANRQLVLRVNELFHDMEGEAYSLLHPEIFLMEKKRWEKILTTFFEKKNTPITVLDIGAGTGFVGERLLPHLQKEDTLICSDISKTMLDITVPRLQSMRPDLHVKPLKMDGEDLALPNESIDIITMNSVLHHIPDTERILHEIARVLRPGGFLYIGHEPNTHFYRSKLFITSNILHHCTFKRIIAMILKKIGLYNRMITSRDHPLLEPLNSQLTAEKLIDSPLTGSEMSSLLDVHSPAAGGIRLDEGYDPFLLLNELPIRNKKIVTYNYLGKSSGKRRWLMPYEYLIGLLFPKKGSIFFIVAQKNI